ncbi:MAG: hypothetical protein M0R06_05570 [Sphaerochaeta sp.]|jgi:hypothetical protein|nr:hypothetical protein [Sphaerochaeta sp.]
MQRDFTGLPTAYERVYRTAMKGKSRLAAVKAFCLECCGWEREQVHDCTDTGCPLWPYRPFRRITRHE